MEPRKINKVLETTPDWQQEGAAFWMLGSFNGGNSWLGKYSGTSPWERHPDGDEFFYILDGAVELTLLMENSSESVRLEAGETFVVPKGLWHRQTCEGQVIVLGATTGRTEHSVAVDPHQESEGDAV